MNLSNKMIAVLIAPKFQDEEALEPASYLSSLGADVRFIGIHRGSCKGKGKAVLDIQALVSEVHPAELDGLIIPGGSAPESLRLREEVLDFVRDFVKSGHPVAAICHGPQVLISANVLRGRQLTCYRGIRDDVTNAGAKYVDQEVVVDRNLVTSRHVKDLPAFNRAFAQILEKFDRHALWAKASAPEILEFAIMNEIKACELYDSMAQKAPDKVAKAKFHYLAEMEKAHQKLLTDIFGTVTGGRKPNPKVLDLPFAEASVSIDPNGTLSDVLRAALANEDAAHALYRGIADRISHGSARQIFLKLAEEELHHKQLLDAELSAHGPRPLSSALEKEPWWSEELW